MHRLSLILPFHENGILHASTSSDLLPGDMFPVSYTHLDVYKRQIYRRHSAECHRDLTKKKKLPVSALRQYMDCGCAIWIEGTKADGTIVPRQSLHPVSYTHLVQNAKSEIRCLRGL